MIGIMYFLLGIIIVISELTRKKDKYIDYFTIFNIYFVAYYIIPSAVSNIDNDYHSRYSAYVDYSNGSMMAFSMVLLSYICVAIGYLCPIQIGKAYTWQPNRYRREIPNENQFFGFIIAGLAFLGMASFVFYSSLYGGIRNTLINAALIRNNAYQTVNDSGAVEFVRRFVVCLQYCAYFIFIRYLLGNSNKIILIIGYILASIQLIVHAGRGAILTFILILILTYYEVTKKKIHFKTWMTMGVGVCAGILLLRPLLVSLSSLNQGFDVFISEFMRRIKDPTAAKVGNDSFQQVVYNLEHKYVSLETAIISINNGNYRFDFFRDIFAALVAIFPSAILPFTKPNSIDYYNTRLIVGDAATGAIPPGGVAMGYYALGILGVIIFSLFTGIIGKRAELYFDSFDSGYLKMVKVINMFVWCDFFINGELREWTLRYFVFIILMIMIFISAKKTRREDSDWTNKKI